MLLPSTASIFGPSLLSEAVEERTVVAVVALLRRVERLIRNAGTPGELNVVDLPPIRVITSTVCDVRCHVNEADVHGILEVAGSPAHCGRNLHIRPCNLLIRPFRLLHGDPSHRPASRGRLEDQRVAEHADLRMSCPC